MVSELLRRTPFYQKYVVRKPLNPSQEVLTQALNYTRDIQDALKAGNYRVQDDVPFETHHAAIFPGITASGTEGEMVTSAIKHYASDSNHMSGQALLSPRKVKVMEGPLGLMNDILRQKMSLDDDLCFSHYFSDGNSGATFIAGVRPHFLLVRLLHGDQEGHYVAFVCPEYQPDQAKRLVNMVAAELNELQNNVLKQRQGFGAGHLPGR